MDELYRARLTADPTLAPHRTGKERVTESSSQPIPIHLPIHPYPPLPTAHPPNEQSQSAPPPETPTPGHTETRTLECPAPGTARSSLHIGPWTISKPHPLLWLCLGLSILALVLTVPKGSLPTLTGRHTALRARERLLDERLRLFSHLSLFLPPPLSTLLSPNTSRDSPGSLLPLFSIIDDYPALRFWSTRALSALGNDDGQWWSVQDLGEGASVVRSKGHGADHKEVWVVRVGQGEAESQRAALSALTHSLLLRDRLLTELDQVKAAPCPVGQPPAPALVDQGAGPERGIHGEDNVGLKDEWERIEERKQRDRLREKDVEEREREVGRREKWVVEEMRKLSDKVHSLAGELTLEERITERLKAYQRQLAAHETERVHEEL